MRTNHRVAVLGLLVGLLATACAPSPPPAPTITSVATALHVFDLAPQGSSLWVLRGVNNRLTPDPASELVQLDATTGAVLSSAKVVATEGFQSGTGRVVVAGGWVWTTGGLGVLTKFDPATGQPVAQVTLPGAAADMEFDGTRLWVLARSATDPARSVVLPVAVNGPLVLGPSIDVPSGADLAVDASYLWVANFAAGAVQKVDRSTGAVLGSFATGLQAACQVARSGGGVFVAGISVLAGGSLEAKIVRLDAVTGQVTSTASAEVRCAGSTNPGIAVDGSSVWYANFNGKAVARFDDAALAATGSVGFAEFPSLFVSAGTTKWVVAESDRDPRFSVATIYRVADVS